MGKIKIGLSTYEINEKLFERLKQEFEITIEQTRKYIMKNELEESKRVQIKEFTLLLIDDNIEILSGVCAEADEFVKYLENIKEAVIEIFE